MIPWGTRQRWAVRAPMAAAAVSGLALIGLFAQRGSVLVHQCVTGDGAAGWLGLRLALLRADPSCPDGGLAVGGDERQVMGVVVMVAVPALLIHVAAVVIGLGMLARLGAVARAAATILATAVRVLPERVQPVVRRARLVLADVDPPALVDSVGSAWSRRGPPRACAV